MAMITRHITAVIAFLFLCNTGKAQADPHFSQYYVYPLWLNPALTGSMEGSYRVSAIYRNQWAGVTDAFSTMGVSADVATGKDINFGANILSQTAGSAGYRYTNGQVSVAYSGIRFGREGQQRIAFALQAGILNRRIDASKLQGGDQWVPVIGYNPAMPSGDIISKSSASVFDAGAGISYFDGAAGKKVNFFGGFSAAHITEPEDPFLSYGQKQKLPARYTLHGGARITIGNAWLVPNLLYMQQGNATETMVGGYVQLAASESTDLMLGANYRFNDAIAPFAGLYFNKMMVGMSYDVNTSTLGKYAGSANSFEISVSFFGGGSNGKGFFKCPRL